MIMPRRAAARTRVSAAIAVIAACVVLACTAPKPVEHPAPDASLAADTTITACLTDAPHVDVSEWRRVRVPLFEFCLPREWTGRAPVWRHGTASIRWGQGKHPAELEGRRDRAPSLMGRPDVPREGASRGEEVHHSGEMIGGRWAELWRNRIGGTWYTGVEWPSERVWLAGQATDARTADLQLDVYRTGRIVEPR